MKIKNFILITIAASLLIFVGCEKEREVPTFGCHDIDSPRAMPDTDYHDSTCVYMYVTEFEISYFEDKSWDPNNPLFSKADLVLKFGDSNMDSVYFDSYRIANAVATTPNVWVAHTQFKLKNKLYAWELYNEATVPLLESDELMTSGLLNPLDFKNDSVIVMTDVTQNTQIKIRYEIR
jgi:hypothetical protein